MPPNDEFYVSLSVPREILQTLFSESKAQKDICERPRCMQYGFGTRSQPLRCFLEDRIQFLIATAPYLRSNCLVRLILQQAYVLIEIIRSESFPR